ncbi:MAG: ribonuclease [Kiritimatiellae bacterium]|nr:ribonuclease [Kiritimatiellia bacterium]
MFRSLIRRMLPLATIAVALLAVAAWGRGGGRARRALAPKATVTQQSAAKTQTATNVAAKASIAADGEYTGRDQVASYLRTYRRLPRNFITKAQARSLGWQGGPLERYAPGKSIGGDHFGNYENKLPRGRYRECDIDTRGKPRGAKRLVYSEDIRSIYYTGDHYRTFEKVP